MFSKLKLNNEKGMETVEVLLFMFMAFVILSLSLFTIVKFETYGIIVIASIFATCAALYVVTKIVKWVINYNNNRLLIHIPRKNYQEFLPQIKDYNNKLKKISSEKVVSKEKLINNIWRAVIENNILGQADNNLSKVMDIPENKQAFLKEIKFKINESNKKYYEDDLICVDNNGNKSEIELEWISNHDDLLDTMLVLVNELLYPDKKVAKWQRSTIGFSWRIGLSLTGLYRLSDDEYHRISIKNMQIKTIKLNHLHNT